MSCQNRVNRLRVVAGMSFAIVASGLVTSGASGIGPAWGNGPIRDAGKIRGDLQHVLDRVGDGLIDIAVVMRDQPSSDVLHTLSTTPEKMIRRERVVRYLKELAGRSQGDLIDELREGQLRGEVGSTIHRLWIRNVVGARVSQEMLLEIASRDDVAYINLPRMLGQLPPGGPQRPAEPANNPLPGDFGGKGADGGGRGGVDGGGSNVECGVDVMGAPQVWNDLGITGSDIVVGVIDTGSCWQHPDLINQVWTNPGEIPGNGIDDDGNSFVDDVHGWSFDFNGSDSDISDGNGHGTHVTGTVAGDGTNGETTGMAPDSRFMTIKFWNNFDGELSVWNGMQYGVDNGADVLTASLGWPHSFNPDRATWRGVVESAIAAGAVVIYAAGNEGNCCGPVDNVRTPGDVPGVITVGATDCNDNLANFSSWGPVEWASVPPFNDFPYPPGKIKPTIAAPGVDTISTSNNCSGYRTLSGTSMATPHVAGAVALILQANPDLDHAGVKAILEETAIDLGDAGFDNKFGAGRVDAYAAVLRAIESASSPAELVDVAVTFGSLVAGGVTEVATSDDVPLEATSALGFSAQRPNMLDIELGFTASGSPNTMDITVETRLNNPGGVASLSVRNVSTGLFESVGDFPVGLDEIVEIFADVDATGRVDPVDDGIALRLRQSVVATFSAEGFKGFLDFVGVETSE